MTPAWMMPKLINGSLFAQALGNASSASRTYYEVMRLRQLDEWWHWLLLVLACLIVLAAVTTMYFLDSRQLARGKRWLLLFLRVMAFVGLLLFFMDLQKRTEQKLVKNSRFAVIVDTSQSMGIADQDTPDGSGKESRIAAVSRLFSESSLLADLRDKHDVTLYRFDETNLPSEVATFSQTGQVETATDATLQPSTEEALSEVRSFWKVALGLFGIALVALILHWVLGNLVRTAEGGSWALLVSVFALIVGMVLVAVSNLRQPEYGPRAAFGWVEVAEEKDDLGASSNDASADAENIVAKQPEPSEVEWSRLLEPAGGSTRMGDAINWVISHERGTPLAGIAVITDGNSNRGIEPLAASVVANDAEIPLYPIGIASDLPPTNVRIVDLEAPARVYPGDEFKLTGYIQAYGMAGQVVDVKMVSRPDDGKGAAGDAADEILEFDDAVELGTDGEVLPIPMQVIPEAVGKRIYTLKVAKADVDRDTSDNQIFAKVQIVDRKSRVLLLAVDRLASIASSGTCCIVTRIRLLMCCCRQQ